MPRPNLPHGSADQKDHQIMGDVVRHTAAECPPRNRRPRAARPFVQTTLDPQTQDASTPRPKSVRLRRPRVFDSESQECSTPRPPKTFDPEAQDFREILDPEAQDFGKDFGSRGPGFYDSEAQDFGLPWPRILVECRPVAENSGENPGPRSPKSCENPGPRSRKSHENPGPRGRRPWGALESPRDPKSYQIRNTQSLEISTNELRVGYAKLVGGNPSRSSLEFLVATSIVPRQLVAATSWQGMDVACMQSP